MSTSFLYISRLYVRHGQYFTTFFLFSSCDFRSFPSTRDNLLWTSHCICYSDCMQSYQCQKWIVEKSKIDKTICARRHKHNHICISCSRFGWLNAQKNNCNGSVNSKWMLLPPPPPLSLSPFHHSPTLPENQLIRPHVHFHPIIISIWCDAHNSENHFNKHNNLFIPKFA